PEYEAHDCAATASPRIVATPNVDSQKRGLEASVRGAETRVMPRVSMRQGQAATDLGRASIDEVGPYGLTACARDGSLRIRITHCRRRFRLNLFRRIEGRRALAGVVAVVSVSVVAESQETEITTQRRWSGVATLDLGSVPNDFANRCSY